MLSYYKQYERIAFMIDFQTIKVFPILHRAVMIFFGMEKRKEYLAFKQMKGIFIGLDRRLRLTTWNLTTGKLLYRKLLKNADELKEFTHVF